MYETIFEHLGEDGALSKITFEFDQRVKVVADYEAQEIRKLHGDIEVKSFCMEGVTPHWFMGYLTGIESEIANRKTIPLEHATTAS